MVGCFRLTDHLAVDNPRNSVIASSTEPRRAGHRAGLIGGKPNGCFADIIGFSDAARADELARQIYRNHLVSLRERHLLKRRITLLDTALPDRAHDLLSEPRVHDHSRGPALKSGLGFIDQAGGWLLAF
jgi:hypothetical protein